jgi:hypothetical protein
LQATNETITTIAARLRDENSSSRVDLRQLATGGPRTVKEQRTMEGQAVEGQRTVEARGTVEGQRTAEAEPE